jgi:hypothetical protein
MGVLLFFLQLKIEKNYKNWIFPWILTKIYRKRTGFIQFFDPELSLTIGWTRSDRTLLINLDRNVYIWFKNLKLNIPIKIYD